MLVRIGQCFLDYSKKSDARVAVVDPFQGFKAGVELDSG